MTSTFWEVSNVVDGNIIVSSNSSRTIAFTFEKGMNFFISLQAIG